MAAPQVPTLNWTYTTGGSITGSPAVADVDGDGRKEVVVGSTDHNVYCLNGATGTKLWNYATGPLDSTLPFIIVSDLNGDGKNEVLVRSEYFTYTNRSITCLNTTGVLKWIWNYTGNMPAPVVSDIDGDGKQEIIAESSVLSAGVYCINSTGETRWNYTFASYPSVSRPVISDVDEDGKQEILVVTFNYVHSLSGAGSLKWERAFAVAFFSGVGFNTVDYPPVVADLNGDGHKEVILTLWRDATVRCLDGKTGGSLWNSTIFSHIVQPHVDVSDIYSDGHQELVVTDQMNGSVYCLSSSGELRWSYSIGESLSCPPTVVDVNGDNRSEIIMAANNGKIYSLVLTYISSPVIPVASLIIASLIIALVVISVEITRRRKK